MAMIGDSGLVEHHKTEKGGGALIVHLGMAVRNGTRSLMSVFLPQLWI